jgi:hypothetical protein
MNSLPIKHLTLYKHGVGFFERRGKPSAESVTLTFRAADMNDILKSLTAIDWGSGQVLGVAYTTPQSQEERLAGCTVRLEKARSMQDLLISLRGRQVRLHLDQAETLAGSLLGLDTPTQDQPLSTSLVSLLQKDSSLVQTVQLGRLQGVEILDSRGIADLRFFLQTALDQDDTREITIRLSAGDHDLSVSYIAPAPTWRVSYRLVADPPNAEGKGQALLLGWGIFDNRLDEDLADISLSLVAGMPISFIYDLYTPFTPERPEVKEEARVAPEPVAFDEARQVKTLAVAEAPALGRAMAQAAAAPAAQRVSRETMANAVAVATTSRDLGELFHYAIDTPVTVRRGQSAMVPILSASVKHRKDLIYNGQKLAEHPVATLRLANDTGLTLERGPVTVLEGGDYVGEAVLPFTTASSNVVIPYAVELGAKVREESGSRRETHGLRIQGHFLSIEEWDIRWRNYQVTNTTAASLTVLIEHPRTSQYELFETQSPKEQTPDHLRFDIRVPSNDEETLRVQERRLLTRREEIRRQSTRTIGAYLKHGLIGRQDHDRLAELLSLWSRIAAAEKRLAEVDKERDQVYKAQQQIQGNMQPLAQTGKEGALRASYVDKLQATEHQLEALAQEETRLRTEIKGLQTQVEDKISQA